MFDFGSHRASPVVLLLDRRDDPVTPLLTQWTYQVCNMCLHLRVPPGLSWHFIARAGHSCGHGPKPV